MNITTTVEKTKPSTRSKSKAAILASQRPKQTSRTAKLVREAIIKEAVKHTKKVTLKREKKENKPKTPTKKSPVKSNPNTPKKRELKAETKKGIKPSFLTKDGKQGVFMTMDDFQKF